MRVAESHIKTAVALVALAGLLAGQVAIAAEGADLAPLKSYGNISPLAPDFQRAETEIGNPSPTTTVSKHSPFIISEPKPAPPFPILLNKAVQGYVSDFLNQPDQLEESFQRSRLYLPEMMQVMRNRGLPDDLVFLSFAESDFSNRGKGPWQFNKATALRYGLHVNSFVDERRDPIMSTRAAAEYLADLHDFAGYDWRVALIGWNVGEGSISRFWSLRGENYTRFACRLPRPTQTLLGRFMAVAFIAHNAEAYGVGRVDYAMPKQYCEVKVKGGTPLAEIAQEHATTVAKLRTLNPALLRDCAPPYAPQYKIRIPLMRTAFAAASSRK